MLMKYEDEVPRIKGGEGGQKERVPIKQRSDGSLGCQRRLSKIMSNRAHSEVIGHWLLTNWTDLTSGTPLSEFPGAPEKMELQRSLPKRETEFQGGILNSPSGLVLEARTPNYGPKMTRGDKTSPLSESLSLLIGELEAQGSFLAREKARVVMFPLRIQ